MTVVRLAHFRRRLDQLGWGLAAEACLELAWARIVTCLPASRYLGDTRAPVAATGDPDLRQASLVGQAVETVAGRMPFRARCLQQALATRRMMRRRGCASTLVLALNPAPAGRADPGSGQAAHAWVRVGETVVCGGGRASDFVVVEQFD
jgi:hypothetical protein